MLTVTQKASFTGESKIDGKTMERYTSQIDIENPESLTLSRFIVNGDGYRDNRDVCQKDQAEFEDIIYAAQAEMLATDSEVSNIGGEE